jgi:hypothetical protein
MWTTRTISSSETWPCTSTLWFWIKKNMPRKKMKTTYITYWKRLCEFYALLAKEKMDGNVLQQMRRVLFLMYSHPFLKLTATSFSTLASEKTAMFL